jgi:hypothetical protein
MNAGLAKPIRMIWFITAGGPDLDQLFFRGASGWFAAVIARPSVTVRLLHCTIEK